MSEKSIKIPNLKRFLSQRPVEYQQAINAAETYVSKLSSGNRLWLYKKPFDPAPGNSEYYRLMYDILNLLKAMNIRPNGRILEVGSGPGWLTEILLMLGFQVDSLEPAADMISIARERCRALAQHHQQDVSTQVRFHQMTIEESEFEDESFDAIIFFDALHHVVDENIALEKAFRYLNAGGCLGVVDGAWHPDNKALELQLLQEMETYGTLENPLSVEYLDYLLSKFGFVDVARYISVNGFLPVEQAGQPLSNFSLAPIDGTNNLTARKPYGNFPECYDLQFPTRAKITLEGGGILPDTGTASVSIQLENTGDTIWRCDQFKRGYVTIALKQGHPSSALFIEAAQRYLLPQDIIPGETINLTFNFTLPKDKSWEGWELDLVSEGIFWFSTRGTEPCPVYCHLKSN